METVEKETVTRKEQKGIVSAISKLRVVKSKNYDWKQDYINTLEEKYESIYRR